MPMPMELMKQLGAGLMSAPLLFGGVSQVAGTPFDAQINAVADAKGIDPTLLAALAFRESSFNPKAKSPSGALGLTQLMPQKLKDYGVKDPFNPMQNLNAGADYLKKLMEMFGNTPEGLAAYNAGPTAVKNAMGIPRFPETINHVQDIMRMQGVGDFDINPWLGQ